MRPTRLDSAAIQTALDALNLRTTEAWQVEQGKLRKRFRFRDFREAFAFMTRVAAIADAMDHHPDWHNVYDKVEVALVTHDAAGLTRLDFELASAMEDALASI